MVWDIHKKKQYLQFKIVISVILLVILTILRKYFLYKFSKVKFKSGKAKYVYAGFVKYICETSVFSKYNYYFFTYNTFYKCHALEKLAVFYDLICASCTWGIIEESVLISCYITIHIFCNIHKVDK